MNEVLLRVFQMKDDMTNKERDIADALLAEPSAVITRSISEYAQYISSSPATITRFCKHVGISGFAELRLSIANGLPDGGTDIDQMSDRVDLNTLNNASDIANGVVANAVTSLKQLLSAVSVDCIEKAADAILSARHIMLCGIGASSLVARDLQQKLVRLGILSQCEDDIDVEKAQLVAFNEMDVVIAFSYSGSKKEVRNIVEKAKENGSTVIAFTKLGANPIAQLADIHLAVAPTEPLVREGATVSRIQMLTVVDMLFQVLISRSGGVYETILKTWTNVSDR